ncbi:MAG: anti-sigma regulatory factor [Leptospiraceae bacterium]|nr:MAG: anti-sigma regulatory factor [Leptospiraceae bacterium]
MIQNELENQIIQMGESGLFGTIKEFYFWHYFLFHPEELTYKNFSKVFHQLIKKNIFRNNENYKNEYIYNLELSFTRFMEYYAPASLNFSPIQFVRSRLLSFLNFHKIDEDIIYDIIIASIEATENAVKYSSDDKIYVKYFIEENTFYIEIHNKYKIPEIKKDIENGKYDSSITLMRGMLVMSKLFDEMDIDLIENKEIAIFQAKKKIVPITKNEKI